MSHPPVIAAPPQGASVPRLLIRDECGPLREAACIARRVVCDTWCCDRAPLWGQHDDAFGLAVDYADWLRKANRALPLPGLRLWPADQVPVETPRALQADTRKKPEPMVAGIKEVAPQGLPRNAPKIGDIAPTPPPPPLPKLRVVTERRVLSAVGRMIDVIA